MDRHSRVTAKTRMLQGSALAVALALSFSFSTLPALAQKACPAEIGIGVIAPVTGSKAEQGAQFTEGAKVAVDEINAAGGVNGSKLQLQSWTIKASRTRLSRRPSGSHPTATSTR